MGWWKSYALKQKVALDKDDIFLLKAVRYGYFKTVKDGKDFGLQCCCFYLSLWDFYLKELRDLYWRQKINYCLGISPGSTNKQKKVISTCKDQPPGLETQVCCLEINQILASPYDKFLTSLWSCYVTQTKKTFKTPIHGKHRSIQCWSHQYIVTDTQAPQESKKEQEVTYL